MHDPDMSRPLCVDGQIARPPEDVGGAPGDAHFLEAISDPTHEEHDHFRRCFGWSFDPGAFDLVLVNRRLSRVCSDRQDGCGLTLAKLLELSGK
ncbi:hypothetical protein [Paraburkholderia sp. BR10954]|uniref:IS1096 element passenger TnpR family protein n=1 Tax=Paraburkholderia sp. BR10954 TaxID=3236995 RepID=UPI0034D20A04